MIFLRDGLMLAWTKLRTRKVRTGLTIMAASLMFGVLFFVILVSTGVFGSLERFSRHGLTSRYIASGSFWSGGGGSYYNNPEVVAIAKRLYNEEIAARKAEAKRLKLDETMAIAGITNPVENEDVKDGFVFANMANPITQKAVKEYEAAHVKKYTADDFLAIAKEHHPIHTYTLTVTSVKSGAVTAMKDGRESFEDKKQQYDPDYRKSPMFSESLTIMPDSLIQEYLISDSKWTPEGGAIPIIIPQFRAEQLLGRSAPPKTASAKERLDYAATIRRDITDHLITACYRNTSSEAQISSAIEAAAEIAKNKNNRDYVQPPLLYELPDPAECGAAIVKRDVRTAAQKAEELTWRQFNAKFGEVYEEPVQQKITYQVVGVSPDPFQATIDGGGLLDVGSLLSLALMNTAPAFGISDAQYAKLPEDSPMKRFYAKGSNLYNSEDLSESGLVEFATASELKNFIADENCQTKDDGTCKTDVTPYKPFSVQSFGSNSAAIDEARVGFMKVFLWALGIIMGIAAIILSFTISRTIADGRRETAIFRAIGFKRIDITTTYLLYVVMLALLVTLVSLAIGVAGAMWLDHKLWLDATISARLSFGPNDHPETFRFISFNSLYLLLVAAGVLGASLIGSVIPLLRNMRRNPIRDMRDE